MKYINMMGEKKLWNHGYVQLWDFSTANTNEESRIEAVTTVASECYGITPKDRKKLYEQLKTEHCGKPSSAFEFVRGYLNYDIATSLRNNINMSTYEDIDESKAFKMTTETCRSMNFFNVATFRLNIPQFLIKQVIRHRQFSFQELSRRVKANEDRPLEYWDLFEDWGVCVGMPKPELMSRIVEDMYRRMICEGVRPEEARSILPMGMYAPIWMQGDAQAFANYFEVRVDSHAQKEHQELAGAMLDLLEEHQSKFFVRVNPDLQVKD